MNKSAYPPSGFLSLLSPASTRGASMSTSAPLDSAFGFSARPGAEVPEEMDSCLTKTRCKSSFNANP